MYTLAKQALKNFVNIAYKPEREFLLLKKRTFESVVGDYVIMLSMTSIVAGIFNFIFNVGKAAYLDIFYVIDIQYLRMINYSLGRATSVVFFYIFAGIFLFFLLSLVVRMFLDMKYTTLLSLMFYSMAPILLFGWVPAAVMPLSVWSIFIFVKGVNSQKKTVIKKDSIKNRN